MAAPAPTEEQKFEEAQKRRKAKEAVKEALRPFPRHTRDKIITAAVCDLDLE